MLLLVTYIHFGILAFLPPLFNAAASDCWDPQRLANMKFNLSPGKYYLGITKSKCQL